MRGTESATHNHAGQKNMSVDCVMGERLRNKSGLNVKHRMTGEIAGVKTGSSKFVYLITVMRGLCKQH